MEKVIITIARQYGSGGKTIGETLARDLGINCYDRELMRLASDESGIAEGLFGKADEKLKNSPLIRITKNVYKGQLIPPESDEFTSNDNLFNYQAKVIRQLAEAESCVIIGRCADYVLKEYDHVISVFVHGSHDFCMKRAKERLGYGSDKDVEKYIAKTDKRIIIIIIRGTNGLMPVTMICVWTVQSSVLKNVWKKSSLILRSARNSNKAA
jgi:cytidylate kinase